MIHCQRSSRQGKTSAQADHSRLGTPNRGRRPEYACAFADIDHGLTKPKHPWIGGQVERMNRTSKDAAVRGLQRSRLGSSHRAKFVQAYNFANRLKTLKGLTPHESSAMLGRPSQNHPSSIRSGKCRD
jgi:hypothetical protein